MKIACYNCALNEEKFVERWLESTKDSDEILVLDTGSTDKTIQYLQGCGATVESITIRPWRFDDAKNAALARLPSDIDIAIQLDMDEVLVEGWRESLEKVWTKETTRLKYKYIWSWHNGLPDRFFYADRISGRHTHRWKNPVHEILVPTVSEFVSTYDDVLIEHHPDNTKSRGHYLPLLELSVQEDPFNDRNSHYLGREYYFNGKYEQAIIEFQRHLKLPTATWVSERCASLRYGAKCHEALNNTMGAYKWHLLSIVEDVHSKEALIDLASFLLRQNDYPSALYYASRAATIPSDQISYINERYAQQEGPYDIMSVSFFYLKNQQMALMCAKKALEYNPNDERLKANLEMML